jgi:uncharacterized protein YdeI (YjbR/CyaY-like superfamily)
MAAERATERLMAVKPDAQIFGSAEEWQAWLAERHTTSPGVWIQFAKKGSGIASVTYPEALDLALRHGWIDAQKDSLDGDYWLQRFVPRGPRSKWSRINTERAAELIDQGLMTAAGLAAVQSAKADGRWAAAYEPPSTMQVPDDLQAALDAEPAARAFFATLSSQNRYALLYRIQDAKRPQTRARRIATFVQMLTEGKTLH